MIGIYDIFWPDDVRIGDVAHALKGVLARNESVADFRRTFDSISLDIRLSPLDIGSPVPPYDSIRMVERNGICITYSVIEPMGLVRVLKVSYKSPSP